MTYTFFCLSKMLCETGTVYVPQRRLGTTDQDQKQATFDGVRREIVLGQVVFALSASAVQQKGSFGPVAVGLWQRRTWRAWTTPITALIDASVVSQVCAWCLVPVLQEGAGTRAPTAERKEP